MTKLVRAGVAGAGVFGGFHANKYTEVSGATLVGIFDADLGRAAAAAEDRGVQAYDDWSKLLDKVDAVTIATPASTHGKLALAALKAGKHVLVEKPIALDLDTADEMIAISDEDELILQVGHQERYVADAFGLFARPAPAAVRSRRLNKFSGRAMDVSVVFDLMIHDLDLLAQFTTIDDVEITHIEARAEHGPKADYVDVALAFPSGLTASLTASRLETSPNRDLTLQYEEGEVRLDFLAREATNTTDIPLAHDFGAGDAPPAFADPLRYGTQRFVDAIRGEGRAPVTGRDGRTALALALMIEEAAHAAGVLS